MAVRLHCCLAADLMDDTSVTRCRISRHKLPRALSATPRNRTIPKRVCPRRMASAPRQAEPFERSELHLPVISPKILFVLRDCVEPLLARQLTAPAVRLEDLEAVIDAPRALVAQEVVGQLLAGISGPVVRGRLRRTAINASAIALESSLRPPQLNQHTHSPLLA